MSLISRGGRLLLANGALTNNPDCCCDVCNCCRSFDGEEIIAGATTSGNIVERGDDHVELVSFNLVLGAEAGDCGVRFDMEVKLTDVLGDKEDCETTATLTLTNDCDLCPCGPLHWALVIDDAPCEDYDFNETYRLGNECTGEQSCDTPPCGDCGDTNPVNEAKVDITDTNSSVVEQCEITCTEPPCPDDDVGDPPPEGDPDEGFP